MLLLLIFMSILQDLELLKSTAEVIYQSYDYLKPFKILQLVGET